MSPRCQYTSKAGGWSSTSINVKGREKRRQVSSSSSRCTVDLVLGVEGFIALQKQEPNPSSVRMKEHTPDGVITAALEVRVHTAWKLHFHPHLLYLRPPPLYLHFLTPFHSVCRLKPLHPPIMRSLSFPTAELLTQSYGVIHGLWVCD